MRTWLGKRFLDFGKGRHPAGLNFGDCFAYALAKATGEPLLYKGRISAKQTLKQQGELLAVRLQHKESPLAVGGSSKPDYGVDAPNVLRNLRSPEALPSCRTTSTPRNMLSSFVRQG